MERDELKAYRIDYIRQNLRKKNTELAEELGCSTSTINILKNEAGLNREKVTAEMVEETRALIVKILGEGHKDIHQLAEAVGLSINATRNHLKCLSAKGITRHNRGYGQRIGAWTLVSKDDEQQERKPIDWHTLPMSRIAEVMRGCAQ